MIAFGVLGYLLRKRNYELGPFILSLVLGPLFEQSLRQALVMSHQNPIVFLTRPISAVMIGISLFLVVFLLVSVWRKGKKAQLFEAPKD
jgi:putative tricarboxylic transport membrane protein